jgi:Protein of unknown function (DUF2934)
MKRNIAREVTKETELEQPGRPELVEEPESRQPGRPKELKDQIRFRAYEIYQQRGMVDGAELDDWLQAEEEIAGELRETS